MFALPEAFEKLTRKYAELLALRAEPLSAEQARPRLRALAREFPGALRELDALPMAELERRHRASAAAAQTGTAGEPWMLWMIAYHDALRVALTHKRRAASARSPQASSARAVREPGHLRGKLSRQVAAELEERFGIERGVLLATLFPRAPSR
jgi:hypothetical protein